MLAVKEAQAIAGRPFLALSGHGRATEKLRFGGKTDLRRTVRFAGTAKDSLPFGRFALLRMLSHLGGTSQPIELRCSHPYGRTATVHKIAHYSEKLVFVSGGWPHPL